MGSREWRDTKAGRDFVELGGCVWGDIREEEFNINSFTAGGGGGRLGQEEEPHSLCQHFIDLVQGCSRKF